MEIYTNRDPHDGYYLAHYGVLGMKWGVRKAEEDRNYVIGLNSSIQKDENRRKYKRGEISKDEYKKNKKRLNEQLERRMKKSKAYSKDVIEDFKRNPAKYKERYKDKYDVSRATRDYLEANKHSEYRDRLKDKEFVKKQSFAFGLIGGLALGVPLSLATSAAIYESGKRELERSLGEIKDIDFSTIGFEDLKK